MVVYNTEFEGCLGALTSASPSSDQVLETDEGLHAGQRFPEHLSELGTGIDFVAVEQPETYCEPWSEISGSTGYSHRCTAFLNREQ